MPPGKGRLRRRAGIASIASCTLIWALVPAAAQGAVGPASDGVLSPRLAELAKPAVHNAPPAQQARDLSVAAEGPGSLLREGNRVLVSVRFEHGAEAGIVSLRTAGAEVVNVNPKYQTVTVAAKPDELRQLSTVPHVAGATEALVPFTAEPESSTCPAGIAVSEGVQQLRAGDGEGGGYESEYEARKRFGVDGSGITVGILSDSFNVDKEAATNEAGDIKTGDLPGDQNTCEGQEVGVNDLTKSEEPEGGEDEGRAMAQIVHDIAPRAELSFATAFTGIVGFASHIEDLAKHGADVIVDDVGYPDEPFFQAGPVDAAVSKVAGEEVAYFSAAGNGNLVDAGGHDIASWETPNFRDSGSCPPAVQSYPGINGSHCLDFDPGAEVDRTFGIKVAPHATLRIDLQWAEPWNGVTTDVDAFLLNSEGHLIAESTENNATGEYPTQMPFEFIGWENNSSSQKTVQLAINRYSGGLPRVKFALLENGPESVTATEYPQSSGPDVVGPTVFGHTGFADATSVGAVPFNNSSAAERYSSRGPVMHYFEPVGGGGPAEALDPPEELSKPDVAAADCGATTFFAQLVSGKWRFCGTSAAAPHAAGVAALMLDADESASAEEVRAAMQAGAADVGGSGPCAVGAGLIEAVGAIEDLPPLGGGGAPECLPPGSEVPPGEARAPGDWGSESPPSTPAPTEYTPNPYIPATPHLGPAPRASFRRHPAKLVRIRGRRAKVVFRFESSFQPVAFLCDVDRGPYHPCPAKLVRRIGLGSHAVRIKARDRGGRVGPVATFRFRVKRVGHRNR